MIKGACGMGAVRLGAHTRFQIGPIRKNGLEILLLGVWTWRDAGLKLNIYCGGWIMCCRKRRKRGVWGSGNIFSLLQALRRKVLRQT